MSRLPGWVKLVGPPKGVLSEDGKSVVFTFRVRRWHPGFWLELLRRLR